jgi:hypothetical protein
VKLSKILCVLGIHEYSKQRVLGYFGPGGLSTNKFEYIIQYCTRCEKITKVIYPPAGKEILGYMPIKGKL